MVMTADFFEERAEEATAEANVATLDNVRERALRSANVWRGMADRARKIEGDRARASQQRTGSDDQHDVPDQPQIIIQPKIS